MASRKKKPVIMMTPETEKIMDVIERAMVAKAEKNIAAAKKSKRLFSEDMFELNAAIWILETFEDISLSNLIENEVDIQWPEANK